MILINKHGKQHTTAKTFTLMDQSISPTPGQKNAGTHLHCLGPSPAPQALMEEAGHCHAGCDNSDNVRRQQKSPGGVTV